MHILIATASLAAAWAWLVAHQLVFGWVLAVLIEQLPPPDATSGKFYAYFYGVVQIVAANIRRTKDAVTVVRTPKP